MIDQTQSGAEYGGDVKVEKTLLTFRPAHAPSKAAVEPQIPIESKMA
jgi:hypothetical protein